MQQCDLFFFISNLIHCFSVYVQYLLSSFLYMFRVSQAHYQVLSQRPHDKNVCRGEEYHRLHVQFRPPDDGPVRPETCRLTL